MRLWLKDSERMPDPPPLKTDERIAIGVGTLLWVVAAILAMVFAAPLEAAGRGWLLAAAIVGVVLGAIGLAYSQVRRSRARRAHRSELVNGEDEPDR